jgi:hypothetical protein
LLPLLRSHFEGVKRCFVDEMYVGDVYGKFVCIMQELKDCWFRDLLKGYQIFEQEHAS